VFNLNYLSQTLL